MCGAIVGSALLLITGILWAVCSAIQGKSKEAALQTTDTALSPKPGEKDKSQAKPQERPLAKKSVDSPQKETRAAKPRPRPKPEDRQKPAVREVPWKEEQRAKPRPLVDQLPDKPERAPGRKPPPDRPQQRPDREPAADQVRLPAKAPKPLVADNLIRVPKEQQRNIDWAIARGVRFLKASLAGEIYSPRRWKRGNRLGAIILTGLTLLECGVPGNDPAVREIARLVRAAAGRLRDTYSLSLALMFLGRLGVQKDRALIQTYALRLIAGQNGRGGWTYHCPVLSGPQERALRTALRQLPPLRRIVSIFRSASARGESGASERKLRSGRRPASSPKKNEETGLDISRAKFTSIIRPLSPALKALPVFRFTSIPVLDESGKGVDDNSNTQFAILGLWGARKHGVPMDRSLALVERRFRTSQNGNGSWGYHYGGWSNADSMTCTGLLGLGLALGLDHHLHGKGAAARLAGKGDPGIQNGLAYLGNGIGRKTPVGHRGWEVGFRRGRGLVPAPGRGRGMGKPKGKKGGRIIGADARGDLYYLWSVERVAMGYGLRTIGGKEWYPWGAELILARQDADGGWSDRYPGLPDTCFALLFLKRANLARDLPTRVLRARAGDQVDDGDLGDSNSLRTGR
jgi:hypothetical protein